MNDKSCLSTIKSEYSRLTSKEKQLADFILKNFESVISMSTSELAEKAGVAKSAVIRFCQTLNFSGYSEFKLMLSRELVRNEQFDFTPYISESDDSADIFKKIFSSNIKTLYDTSKGLDTDLFKKAVNALKDAKHIYVCGVGTSAGIAADFQYRLTEVGRYAFYFTDVVSIKVSSMNIKQDDVVIGISNSGRTRPTVDALKYAKEKGIKTISVTSYPNSEIVKYSDIPLVIKTDEIQYPIEAISAHIAHISLLDSLAVSLSASTYNDAADRSAQNHDLIEELRY